MHRPSGYLAIIGMMRSCCPFHDGDIFKLANLPENYGSINMLNASFSKQNNHLLLQAFEPIREGYLQKRSIYIEFDDLRMGSQFFSATNTAQIDFVVDGSPNQVKVYVANSGQSGFRMSPVWIRLRILFLALFLSQPHQNSH